MLKNDKLTEHADVMTGKKAWHKPDVVVIEDTNATKASKANHTTESSPLWGIS